MVCGKLEGLCAFGLFGRSKAGALGKLCADTPRSAGDLEGRAAKSLLEKGGCQLSPVLRRRGAWAENRLPEKWTLPYEPLGLTFEIKPMGFKHTGVFPEQAVNWEWFSERIRQAGRPVKVLNLFAYTGGATLAAAKAGAQVCHVDASKGMVQMAKNNARLSGLESAPIRYIVDDCRKFVERELRRGSFYDAVIMDPPSYGRGPSGEVWKLEDHVGELIELVSRVLSPKPLFFLVNSYTTGLSPSAMGYLLSLTLLPKYGGRVEADEIGIPVKQTGAVLPCGSSARWVQK